jgi:hypothetical protein
MHPFPVMVFVSRAAETKGASSAMHLFPVTVFVSLVYAVEVNGGSLGYGTGFGTFAGRGAASGQLSAPGLALCPRPRSSRVTLQWGAPRPDAARSVSIQRQSTSTA